MQTFGDYVLLSMADTAGAVCCDDDCACPADGLELEPADHLISRHQAVRLHLEPIDHDLQVGYSPFLLADRS